jgi:hypothetical protein
MDPIILRVAGISLSAAGALLLAFRVKRILDALVAVAHCHEMNLRELTRPHGDIVQFVNSTRQVEKAQKAGTWLLSLGFGCIFVGNVLNAISILLH